MHIRKIDIWQKGHYNLVGNLWINYMRNSADGINYQNEERILNPLHLAIHKNQCQSYGMFKWKENRLKSLKNIFWAQEK